MNSTNNYYRNATGVAQKLKRGQSDVVKYDTLQRKSSNSSEQVGVLHAGVVSAVKHSK